MIISGFSVIHGIEAEMNGLTVILMMRVENVQQRTLNTNIEFKKRKDEWKNVFLWCEI